MSNTFSETWFRTFLHSINPSHSENELKFVCRHLPRPAFPRVLDLCCGGGRHAAPLTGWGYDVVGLDRVSDLLHNAPRSQHGPHYMVGDLHGLPVRSGTFDGVINLWHSFGYLDDDGNAAVLADVRRILRAGGRAILDIYNRDHLRHWPLEEEQAREGVAFRITRQWSGNRLCVKLLYASGERDVFDWRVYTPDEMRVLCQQVGLSTLHCCALFDEQVPASDEFARMQLVLENANAR